MKRGFYFLMSLLLAALPLGICSCDDDDDETETKSYSIVGTWNWTASGTSSGSYVMSDEMIFSSDGSFSSTSLAVYKDVPGLAVSGEDTTVFIKTRYTGKYSIDGQRLTMIAYKNDLNMVPYSTWVDDDDFVSGTTYFSGGFLLTESSLTIASSTTSDGKASELRVYRRQ